MKNQSNTLCTLGWREWLTLPALNIHRIAAKVDTGAKTSCLHTFNVSTFDKDGALWVRFGLHPIQDNSDVEIWREAAVVDQRTVTDSGGHQEQRYVIRTDLSLNGDTWPIEITLTNRDNMRFRMLLGRTAMNGHCLVNPAASWLLGDSSAEELDNHKQLWLAEMANAD